ncbi:MAG TPA: hypothetical protein VHA52_04700 [Candidatus Babeliaceae bacterium]|nr:hypothetical protein [Candidatus Babeliaceae bacterium]
MATVRLSKKFSIQIPDVIRGGLMAVGAAMLTVIQQSVQNNEWDFNWKFMATTAVSTFVVYLAKNGLFEPAKIVTTVDTNAKAVNATEKIKDAVQ